MSYESEGTFGTDRFPFANHPIEIETAEELSAMNLQTMVEDAGVLRLPEKATIPSSSLYHYPLLDRSSSTISEQLTGADATANGTTTVTGDWWESYAEDGDGSSAYISGPQEWAEWIEDNRNRWLAFTIDAAAGQGRLFGGQISTADSGLWRIQDRGVIDGTDGILQFSVEGTDGNLGAIYTDNPVLDGNKHRIVWQRTGPTASDLEFWVDGTKVPVTVDAAGGWNGTFESTINPYALAYELDGSPAAHSNATIDNIIFGDFGTTLSSTEIQNDYESQPWVGTSASSVYDSVSALSHDYTFDPTANVPNGSAGVSLRDDGTQMWVSDRSTSPPRIVEYSLSTGWDLSTASFVQGADFNQDDQPMTPTVANSGTKLYVPALDGFIYEYDLSTAYDISTKGSVVNSYEITYLSENHPLNIEFYDAGSSALIGMGQEDDVAQFSLSTAYDISTLSQVASYNVQNEMVGDKLGGVRLRNSEQDMFVVNGDSANSDNAIYHWKLTTAGDLTTTDYQGKYDVSGQTSAAQDLAIKPDGTAVVIADTSTPSFLEYRV